MTSSNQIKWKVAWSNGEFVSKPMPCESQNQRDVIFSLFLKLHLRKSQTISQTNSSPQRTISHSRQFSWQNPAGRVNHLCQTFALSKLQSRGCHKQKHRRQQEQEFDPSVKFSRNLAWDFLHDKDWCIWNEVDNCVILKLSASLPLTLTPCQHQFRWLTSKLRGNLTNILSSKASASTFHFKLFSLRELKKNFLFDHHTMQVTQCKWRKENWKLLRTFIFTLSGKFRVKEKKLCDRSFTFVVWSLRCCERF